MEPNKVKYEIDNSMFESPMAQPPKPQTKRPMFETLNLNFTGADAKVVWEKLCAISEVWGLPGEMPDSELRAE